MEHRYDSSDMVCAVLAAMLLTAFAAIFALQIILADAHRADPSMTYEQACAAAALWEQNHPEELS